MSAPRTVLGLVVASGLLLGGGVAAGALAATGALASSTPSASPSGAPSGPAGRAFARPRGDGRHPGALGPGLGRFGPGTGRMLHGEVVVGTDGGGTETLLVQRGTVTATADGTVTVRSTDGFTTTWKVTSATTVLAGRPGPDRAAGTLADVAKDAEVVVTGPVVTAGDPTARLLAVRPAGTPDGARDPMRTHRRDGDGRRGPSPSHSPSASPSASPAVLQG